MKKLLFSLMFLPGLFLFTSCQEEDPRDNLPQFGENNFEWLKHGAEFIYTTASGDSILMRYELEQAPNIFRKIVVPFSAGDTILKPGVLDTLTRDTTYVQPGLNNQKPSLWESNNRRMMPKEEIYKFDEAFGGRNWHFTIDLISSQNWVLSTTPGQFSLMNTRTISGTNQGISISNAKDSIIATIFCLRIDLISEYSDGNRVEFASNYVNQQYGLIKATGFFGNYTLARAQYNPNSLPEPPEKACYIFTITVTVAGVEAPPTDLPEECDLTAVEAEARKAELETLNAAPGATVQVTYQKVP
ncbi:MAG: hypothetical protein LBR75_00345 [Prevotellaceae bacterium]|jgi:hypothetical protein|nr:hypothetical protein [Prevotellaceae bacterium]